MAPLAAPSMVKGNTVLIPLIQHFVEYDGPMTMRCQLQPKCNWARCFRRRLVFTQMPCPALVAARNLLLEWKFGGAVEGIGEGRKGGDTPVTSNFTHGI